MSLTDPAAAGPTYKPDLGTLARLLVAIPGFLGALYIIDQGWRNYSVAARENAALPLADQRENVAGGLAMGVGQALILIGVLVAALVLATMLPRRLSAWWGGAVLLAGGLMLAYGLAALIDTGDPRVVLTVAFAPIAAAIRLLWQASHEPRLAPRGPPRSGTEGNNVDQVVPPTEFESVPPA